MTVGEIAARLIATMPDGSVYDIVWRDPRTVPVLMFIVSAIDAAPRVDE